MLSGNYLTWGVGKIFGGEGELTLVTRRFFKSSLCEWACTHMCSIVELGKRLISWYWKLFYSLFKNVIMAYRVKVVWVHNIVISSLQYHEKLSLTLSLDHQLKRESSVCQMSSFDYQAVLNVSFFLFQFLEQQEQSLLLDILTYLK